MTAVRLTFVTGGSGVPWLTVTHGLAALWHATLAVSTALPPAGRWLLPSVTVLALVAVAALASVGLALGHTHPVITSENEVRREGNPEGICTLVPDNLERKPFFSWQQWKVFEQTVLKKPTYPHFPLKNYQSPLWLTYLLFWQGFGTVVRSHREPLRPAGQSHVTPVSAPSLHAPWAHTLQEWHPASMASPLWGNKTGRNVTRASWTEK